MIALSLDEYDFNRGIENSMSYFDDLKWSWYVMGPFTWQRFIDWWVARHAVQPRDVRRR